MAMQAPHGPFDIGAGRAVALTRQVPVGQKTLLLLPESLNRIGAVLTNTGNATVMIGPKGCDLTNDGHALPSNQSLAVATSLELYALSPAGTNVITTFEEVVR